MKHLKLFEEHLTKLPSEINSEFKSDANTLDKLSTDKNDYFISNPKKRYIFDRLQNNDGLLVKLLLNLNDSTIDEISDFIKNIN